MTTSNPDPVLVLRQQQNNDLLAKQQLELRRIEQRQMEARGHLLALQMAELDAIREKHRREIAALMAAQGRQLGPWATAQLERKAVANGRA